MARSARNSSSFATVPNSGMFGMPLAVASARIMSSAPTPGTTAAKRSGRSVIARPTRMPPALRPMMPSRALVVYFCAIRYSAAAMKVLPGVGLGRLVARLVPVVAVDAAAANVRHRVDAAALEPREPRRRVVRLLQKAVRAVAVEQRRIGAVELDVGAMDDGERHLGAVVTRHLHFGDDQALGRVEWPERLQSRIGRRSGALHDVDLPRARPAARAEDRAVEVRPSRHYPHAAFDRQGDRGGIARTPGAAQEALHRAFARLDIEAVLDRMQVD